ncbi:MAG: CBS domain-containing protein [Saprospiraceae bacterium]|nr:CBS domain-containing protein [Saprospiraceae bacterium]
MKSTPVTKFMAKDLITFRPETDIREAIEIILKNKISGAPVVDDHRHLIGMLSESDCIKTILAGPYNNLPAGQGTVRDFMSTKVVTVDAAKTIVEVAYEFSNTQYRRFPVVDRGKLIGQISRSDILRAILKMKPEVTHIPSSWKGREPQDKHA